MQYNPSVSQRWYTWHSPHMATPFKVLRSQQQQVKFKAKQQVAWLLMLRQLVLLLQMALLVLGMQRSSSWFIRSGALVCSCTADAARSRSTACGVPYHKRVRAVATCCCA
jgi:hypothetical protein